MTQDGKPTLWLHIGLRKTGTTTVQAAFAQNRKLLEGLGLFYPESPGKQNHTELALYASNGPGARHLLAGADVGPDGIDNLRQSLARNLAEEIAACGVPDVILSNEHLSSNVQQPIEIKRLRDLLVPLFSRIHVVVYLRDQPDLYLSTTSTIVKSGGQARPAPPLSDQDKAYNFEIILNRWASVFGEEAMHVRLFGKGLLHGGDILSDFFNLLGRPMPADMRLPERKNPRLDRAAIRFIELFHDHVPRLVGQRINPDHGDFIRLLETLPVEQPFALPPEEMEQIAQTFAESNDRIARKYFGRPGPLFPPVTYPPVANGPDLTAERAVAIAAFLWRQKQTQLRDRARPGAGRNANQPDTRAES